MPVKSIRVCRTKPSQVHRIPQPTCSHNWTSHSAVKGIKDTIAQDEPLFRLAPPQRVVDIRQRRLRNEQEMTAFLAFHMLKALEVDMLLLVVVADRHVHQDLCPWDGRSLRDAIPAVVVVVRHCDCVTEFRYHREDGPNEIYGLIGRVRCIYKMLRSAAWSSNTDRCKNE